MDRDEILARSRSENKNVMDEREKDAQTKANSVSQGVGMILCILIGAIGMGLTGMVCTLWASTSIYTGMFAAERIAVAIRLRSKGLWLLAGIATTAFLAVFVVFIISGVKKWVVNI